MHTTVKKLLRIAATVCGGLTIALTTIGGSTFSGSNSTKGSFLSSGHRKLYAAGNSIARSEMPSCNYSLLSPPNYGPGGLTITASAGFVCVDNGTYQVVQVELQGDLVFRGFFNFASAPEGGPVFVTAVAPCRFFRDSGYYQFEYFGTVHYTIPPAADVRTERYPVQRTNQRYFECGVRGRRDPGSGTSPGL